MKRLFLTTLTVAAAVLMLAAPATAQVTASADLVVTANNQGIFTFALTNGDFDFGNVDNDSTTASSAGVPVTAAGQSALYTALAADAWTCRSAPPRTVAIYNNTASAAPTLPTDVTEDQLQIRIPSVGGGGSVGYIDADVTGAVAGELISGMTVGNGANEVNGNVDLRLYVDPDDGLGPMQWNLVLTASGS